MIQRIIKICLIGDFSVGKTSLVRRFVESRFDDRYLTTLGVRVSRKALTLAELTPTNLTPTNLTMLLWDTTGGEAFTPMVRTYYQGSGGALLVVDLTREQTIESLHKYAQEFRSVNPNAPLVVIGNKLDLTQQRVVSNQQLAEAAAALDADWVLGSAKTGEGVDSAFQRLGTVLEHGKTIL